MACGPQAAVLTSEEPPPSHVPALEPVDWLPARATVRGKGMLSRAPVQVSVWTGAGGWIEFPANYPAAAYGPMFRDNRFSWITFKLHHGTSETTPDRAAVAGWIKSWRPYVKYVGAWGWNVGSADQAAVEGEAKWTAELIRAFNADADPDKRIDFYIANAEASFEYSKCGACYSASAWWSAKFAAELPNLPRGLSSMGRTDLADIGWQQWRDHGFHWLPQAYWNAPESGGGTCDLAARSRFKTATCVDYADICPGSAEAAAKGIDCAGSPADCPCFKRQDVHPTIGWGWGCSDASSGTPTMDEVVADLVAAHDQSQSVGFSVYRVDNGGAAFGFPALFSKLKAAMEQHGIATWEAPGL